VLGLLRAGLIPAITHRSRSTATTDGLISASMEVGVIISGSGWWMLTACLTGVYGLWLTLRATQWPG
jgi:hypothetical protein